MPRRGAGRYIVSHSANMSAMRMAIEVLTQRADTFMDPPVQSAMRRIVGRMSKNLHQLEREDRDNKRASQTWDSMPPGERAAFTYRDRAQLSWLELEPWERSQLVYRMVQLSENRQALAEEQYPLISINIDEKMLPAPTDEALPEPIPCQEHYYSADNDTCPNVHADDVTI